MATNLSEIANDAASRLGGFGDAADGSDLITQAQITANTIPVAKKVNIFYPKVRKKVIKQFAVSKTPFRETQKFAISDKLVAILLDTSQRSDIIRRTDYGMCRNRL